MERWNSGVVGTVGFNTPFPFLTVTLKQDCWLPLVLKVRTFSASSLTNGSPQFCQCYKFVVQSIW